MRKRRKRASWLDRHLGLATSVVIGLSVILIALLTLFPNCPAQVRPAEMPKVTPQIKPPYQWGQRA